MMSEETTVMRSTTRWEIWIWNSETGCFRFNGDYNTRAQALSEEAWYERHKYTVDIRIRTTGRSQLLTFAD